jgi:hypothetical protein
MIETCDVCGSEVALLHPVSLLKLIQTVGEEQADAWRDCWLCKTWTNRWTVTVEEMTG